MRYDQFIVRDQRLADARALLAEMRRLHGDDCVDTVLACASVHLTGLLTTDAYLTDRDAEGTWPFDSDAA
jgi:3-keto-L-gulonate-6-phosphate decarboxylase